MTQITFALTKGRILKEALPLLASLNILPVDDVFTSRKLVFATNRSDLRLLILRGSDVPTYVQYGAADVGITGKDTLLEHQGDGYYEPLDLGIGHCKLVTAAHSESKPHSDPVRVATKYVNIARQFYAQQGRQFDLIKLYGAMELAPVINFAHEIVDIVDTGSTLRANGLVVLQEIADISSRLIVNKAAMKTKYMAIHTLVEDLRAMITANSAGVDS